MLLIALIVHILVIMNVNNLWCLLIDIVATCNHLLLMLLLHVSLHLHTHYYWLLLLLMLLELLLLLRSCTVHHVWIVINCRTNLLLLLLLLSLHMTLSIIYHLILHKDLKSYSIKNIQMIQK